MSWSPWYTAAGVALLLCFWSVGAHNRLMALRAAIHGAWVPLDALLAERAQALQALVDALRPALGEDTAGLDALEAACRQVRVATEQVRACPSRADAVAGLAAAEAALQPALARLQARVEADEALRQAEGVAAGLLMLPTWQARLASGRNGFNDTVQRYNDAVRQFPTQLLAPLLRFAGAGRL